ncbi:MAG: glycosyltransferase [Pseudomonadota bacterium]
MDQVRQHIEGLIGRGDYLGAFQTLLSEGATPGLSPSLWERLGSAAREGGADSLAHQIHMSLWDAGVGSTVVALDLAQDRLRDGRFRDAAYFLTETFGTDPNDPEARALLAEVQMEIAPKEAIRLTGERWKSDARAALVRIDALRALDDLGAAQDAIRAARVLFPDDSRLVVRDARNREALGDWTGAIASWEALARDGAEAGAAPGVQIVRLHKRFERHSDALVQAAPLLATRLSVRERLRMADILEQACMVPAILQSALEQRLEQSEGRAIARVLRARGEIGALAWMAARGLQVPGTLHRALEGAFGDAEMRRIQTGSLTAAMKVKSPDCLLPLSRDAVRSFRKSADLLTGAGGSAHLIVNATLSAGGAERQFVMLARALKQNGISPGDIHLAVFSLVKDRGHAHFLPALEAEGLAIHHLRGATRMSGDTAGDLAPFLTLLPDPLRGDVLALLPLAIRLGPALLHGWQDRSSLACGVVGQILGTARVVMSSRNMRPDLRGDSAAYGDGLYRHLLKLRPGITLTANSLAGAKDYADWIGMPADMVSVIGNAIETERFPDPGAPGGLVPSGDTRNTPLRIGGVFRLAANKRPELWLRTLAALKPHLDRRLHVKLIGRGPFEAQLRALAQDLGLDDFEIQSGLSDPVEIYGEMDALLLMSRVEGTPNVLLEAQACGIPVAACDVGGVRDAICPDWPGSGLVLPEDISPTDAAEQIADWLPQTRDPKAPIARRAFIDERYGLDALKTAVQSVYGIVKD